MGDHEIIESMEKLLPSEQRFIAAMRDLGYGRFESVKVRGGELLLEPWPTTIRSVKFGGATPNRPSAATADCEPKKQRCTGPARTPVDVLSAKRKPAHRHRRRPGVT